MKVGMALAWLCAAGAARTAELAFTIMAANLSGGDSTYGPPAERIFQGLKPDVVAIQEWTVAGGTHRAFVDRVFGTGFAFYVESQPRDDVPNGIISRWPIKASGEWMDRIAGNRDFAWATIDLPGPRDLHVVSVHFKSGTDGYSKLGRRRQADALMRHIRRAKWPATDYLVIAGDLNVIGRNETTLRLLGQLVSDRHQPADQRGDRHTNIPRNQEYDFVLPGPSLDALHAPVAVGGRIFPEGLVFDSRIWTPAPPPIRTNDSAGENLQHLAVMKAFRLPPE